MAKEKVKQEAVTEETEVAEVSEETTEEPTSTEETANAEDDELSPWYYFFSQGCGWCKKSTPIVEELIDEGHDILMLDTAEAENSQLNQELQQEYGKKCGTPWFINADTGEQICGFREKNILKQWLAGESIPEPPRLKSQMPKPPFQGSTEKENNEWIKKYDKWVKDNNQMGDSWVQDQKSGQEILDNPRPKSDPPRPPMGPQATEQSIDNWGKEMTAWQKENNHLPNLPNVDMIVANFKSRMNQQNPGTQANGISPDQNARFQRIEQKLDKLMNHLGIK
tara:strand:- start:294 stop:1133 length:840 start_codon:yes stop_codon:yes gene_type:complete